ncbi:MAG: hypothetical protein ACRCV9_07810 [Burkholderiaceae bacterium]
MSVPDRITLSQPITRKCSHTENKHWSKNMTNRKLARSSIDPQVWEVFTEIPAWGGKGAELIGGTLENQEISLRGAACLYTEGCTFRNVVLSDLTGAFSASDSLSPCRFENCTFRGFRLDYHFIWGHAEFIDCQFLDFRAKEAFSYDASFVGCKFVGRASAAVFWIAQHIRKHQDSPLELRFEGNDFTEFVCPNLNFRGGISLRNNNVRESDMEVVLLEFPEAVARLEQSGRVAAYSALQRKCLDGLVEICAIWQQHDLYIPSTSMKLRIRSPEERAVISDLKEVMRNPDALH